MSLCACGAFPTVQWYGTSFETGGGAEAIVGPGAVWQPASAARAAAIINLPMMRTCCCRWLPPAP